MDWYLLDDLFPIWMRVVLGIVVVALFLWPMPPLFRKWVKEEQAEKAWETAFFARTRYDEDDVDVFLSGTGYDLKDLMRSPGLCKQYEQFRDGKSSSFIENAKSKKQSDDASSSGMTT